MRTRNVVLMFAVAIRGVMLCCNVFSSQQTVTSNNFLTTINNLMQDCENNSQDDLNSNIATYKKYFSQHQDGSYDSQKYEILGAIMRSTNIIYNSQNFVALLLTKLQKIGGSYEALRNLLFQSVLHRKSRNKSTKLSDYLLTMSPDNISSILSEDKQFLNEYTKIKNNYNEAFQDDYLFKIIQNHVISDLKKDLQQGCDISEYAEEFYKNIQLYFSFTDKSQSNMSPLEKFHHNVYLCLLEQDKTSSNGQKPIQILGKAKNLAYVTISTDNDENADNNNLFVLSNTTFKERVSVCFQNSKNIIEYWKKNITTYDADNFFDIKSFAEMMQQNPDIAKLIYSYLDVKNGRDIAYDDEIQILYYLFSNADTIIKKIGYNNNTNTINIKLFTYMDMCPSCFIAWRHCYQGLLKRYKECSKNSNINLNIEVHSIKPYTISLQHPFICDNDYITDKKLTWDNIQYRHNEKIRLLEKCVIVHSTPFTLESNSNDDIKQFIDLQDIRVLQMRSEKTLENLKKELQNYVKAKQNDNIDIDFDVSNLF